MSEHVRTPPGPKKPLRLQRVKVCVEDVSRVFKKQKTRKASGPDGISSACLKACADQLAPVFTQIFNRSLEQCEVPCCFKRSTIIPVPKKPKITGLNDYRPVGLRSVVMKSFERLVLAYLKDITGPLLDPFKFAYRANRSVDDAVNMGLHYILQHLDRPGTYARILFVDFSSAFNTIIPDLLTAKLTQLSMPSSICQWISIFLTDRQQRVRLGKLTSRTLTISTGAPQGCVLSPLLFSLYTNDCTSKDPSVKLLKFADDTTVIGLIQNGDESAYRLGVEQLAVWCSYNNLELNTLKTVEMIVDFRRKSPALPPLTIMNSTLEAVESFRFLGSTISQDLKWANHIDSIVKKAQQRLYFLRQLKKFNLPQELLIQFYSAVIEIAGEIFATSSAQGGPAPRFLQRSYYNFLVSGKLSLDHVLDPSSSPLITTVAVASDMTDYIADIMDCGYTGKIDMEHKENILRAIGLHVMTKRMPMLQQLREGLDIYGFSQVMQAKTEESRDESVDSHYITSHLAPEMSERGCNKRHKETQILEHFQEFLHELEDDLILMARNQRNLHLKLDGLHGELKKVGMSLNVKKSVGITLVKDPQRKTVVLLPEEYVTSMGNIRPLGIMESQKYLGLKFNWKGKVVPKHTGLVESMLNQLKEAPLKPFQRLEILRVYLVPMLTHELVLGGAQKNTLKKLDMMIRMAVRGWFRLPKDTSLGFLHAPIVRGGLNIPCMEVTIGLLQKARFEKLLLSNKPIDMALREQTSFQKILQQINLPCRVGRESMTSRVEAKNQWAVLLQQSIDGRELACEDT
ncbi:unnamed protein product [Leuciscus chuanchicus]